MIASPLICDSYCSTRMISIEGIKASITQCADSEYEVLLEVNSNKMLIALQGALDMIEEFEIIAIR